MIYAHRGGAFYSNLKEKKKQIKQKKKEMKITQWVINDKREQSEKEDKALVSD